MPCLLLSLNPKVTAGQMEPPVTLLCPQSVTIALVASPPISLNIACPPISLNIAGRRNCVVQHQELSFFCCGRERIQFFLPHQRGGIQCSVSVARLYHPHSILPYPLIFSPFSVLFFFCMLCCIHLSICYWQDSEYRIFFVFGDGYMRKNTLSSDSIDSDVILHSFNSKWLS